MRERKAQIKQQDQPKDASKGDQSSSFDKRSIFLFCGLAVVAFSFIYLVTVDSGVKRPSKHRAVGEFIDTTNFDSKVISSEEVWAIEFWDPTCGGCAEFNPIWARFSRTIRGRKFKFGVVNIETPKGKELCVKILGENATLPTVKLYKYIGGREVHMSENPVPFKTVKTRFKEEEQELVPVKEKGKFYKKVALTNEKKIQLDEDDLKREEEKKRKKQEEEEAAKKSQLTDDEKEERRRKRQEKYGKKTKQKKEENGLR